MRHVQSRVLEDEQLEALLPQRATWFVRGMLGQTLAAEPSLELAVRRATVLGWSGVAVTEVGQPTSGGIVIFPVQIRQLAAAMRSRLAARTAAMDRSVDSGTATPIAPAMAHAYPHGNREHVTSK